MTQDCREFTAKTRAVKEPQLRLKCSIISLSPRSPALNLSDHRVRVVSLQR